MNVKVNIERLILDGIDLPHYQHPWLQAAVEAELARLLATDGLAPALLDGGRVPRLSGAKLHLSQGLNPIQLGGQIARAVYRGIGR